MSRQFLVGRQPIFDDQLEVFGYELLFRSPAGGDQDGDRKTADVLVHAGLDIGLDRLVGTKLAFVNATRSFLVSDQDFPLPPERVVVEVLEDIVADEAVVAGCRRLVAKGYRLALDDYVWRADDPLLPLAAIVKLDVLTIPGADLARQVERCSVYGAKLVAEKVENLDQLEACRRAGFDLFQGYLLSRPETVAGAALTASRTTCLQLVRRLCEPDISFDEMQRIVETDVGLSHHLLRAAGSGAAGGLRRPVSSIREALLVLGLRRLRSWVTLMLVAGANGGSDEQVAIAMTRARMGEQLAAEIGLAKPDTGFTVGLVSALDLLLGRPLDEIVDNLALTPEVEAAILDHSGPLGAILGDILDWELGRPPLPQRSAIDPATMEECYLEALSWASEVSGLLALAG